MQGRRFRLRIRGLIALIVVIAIVGGLFDAARVIGGDLQSSPDGSWLMEGKQDTINVFAAHALFKNRGGWAKVVNGRFLKWNWKGPKQIDAVVSKGSIVKTWTDGSQGIKFNVTGQ